MNIWASFAKSHSIFGLAAWLHSDALELAQSSAGLRIEPIFANLDSIYASFCREIREENLRVPIAATAEKVLPSVVGRWRWPSPPVGQDGRERALSPRQLVGHLNKGFNALK